MGLYYVNNWSNQRFLVFIIEIVYISNDKKRNFLCKTLTIISTVWLSYSLITLFKVIKNDKNYILQKVINDKERTEPHQDSAAYKAIVKWENAGKGIRQTGFVPSVYGLALVYDLSQAWLEC